jgi:hypothetical protein
MCTGMMFDDRLSLVMAAIAKISGSVLKDEAEKLLLGNIGRWIDLTQPENNSMDFARLMCKIPEVLTQTEFDHFRAILQVGNLKDAKDRKIEVEVSYSSCKTRRKDYKDICKKCKQLRSMSLLLDDTCALCIVGKSGRDSCGDFSWMCECRSCQVHYAVDDVDGLKCKPKCHFCRTHESHVTPFIECKVCLNKFLYQQSKYVNNFKCTVCESSDKNTDIQLITVADYINQNGASFLGMDIDCGKFFNPQFRMTPEERMTVVRNFQTIDENAINNHYISHKRVWNVADIQKSIFDMFTKPHLGQCMFCFESVLIKKLVSICGTKRCTATACRECMIAWYNQLVPGKICQPAHILCPYCKKPPMTKTVKQYNKQLCALINITDVSNFDPSYIYAWCKSCYELKQAMPRVCTESLPPAEMNFICHSCITISIKRCPMCSALTEKIDGCNHIQCLAKLDNGEVCNAHWCWKCENLSTYEDIYEHMSLMHGGYFCDDDQIA